MYVWLYVFLGSTRACVCRCDDDVICVGHDLNRLLLLFALGLGSSQSWFSASR